MRKKIQPTFWVTNVCSRNVTLADLALTIKAFTTVNLLDARHYYLTLEQLQKSADSGSLFKKQRLVKVRDKAPEPIFQQPALISSAVLPNQKRSILEIKEENYDELKISDDDYAETMANLADPIPTKGK